MYDLNSNNPNPIISYDGVNKNIASVGFHEDGRWMYTGGEDCTARIWDLRCGALGGRRGQARDCLRSGSLQVRAETEFSVQWFLEGRCGRQDEGTQRWV